MSTMLRYAAAVVFMGILLPELALAQSFPNRPLRILVGFQAGGGVDISARAIAKHLNEALGQSVIVDNRPGAAGNIAAGLVAKATPDGYTLLMSNSTIAIPSLFLNLPYDITRDLQPVSLIAIGPSVLTTHPALPVTTVKDLIALAKSKPKQLSYGSGGIGNITHLEMELVRVMTGVEMVHVPYKGSAPSIVGLVSNEVQVLFTSIPAALTQIKSGRIKPIAVSTLKRSSALPHIPTLDEAGLAGYDAASWYGLFAPTGSPASALVVLGRELVKIMQAPEIRERFMADGFEPAGLTPDQFAKYLREEIAKWAKVVKVAGIKAE
jgi:tripartite-type tricarboxylate transporter receptor subunit TctC